MNENIHKYIACTVVVQYNVISIVILLPIFQYSIEYVLRKLKSERNGGAREL